MAAGISVFLFMPLCRLTVCCTLTMRGGVFYLPEVGKGSKNVKETIPGNNEVMEIDLLKLLLAYLHKWWLILLCTLIAGGGALLYTVELVVPQYRASITVYVNNVRSGERVEYVSGSNLQASQQLVSTYSKIITSDTVLTEVAKEAGLDYTPDTMRGLLSTEQLGDTELFKVYITHTDPKEAARIANIVANVAPARIEGIVEGSSTKIIDYATVPVQPSSPSYVKNTAVGALLGCVLAVGYVTLRCLLDVRIKDEEDITALFAYPVLGQIPHFEQNAGKRSTYGTPYVASAERKGA